MHNQTVYDLHRALHQFKGALANAEYELDRIENEDHSMDQVDVVAVGKLSVESLARRLRGIKQHIYVSENNPGNFARANQERGGVSWETLSDPLLHLRVSQFEGARRIFIEIEHMDFYLSRGTARELAALLLMYSSDGKLPTEMPIAILEEK